MANKQNKVSICLWTHVQNESKIIRKMLESVYDYIDYWVIVDNGSEDETQEIIKDFFKEKEIDGILHQSEIGWKGHGINRQYAWDFLNKTKHNCDFILRIDADEKLVVSDDFDWSSIDNEDENDAYGILYTQGGFCVPRMWLWKSKVDWYWQADEAHETIHKLDGSPYIFKTLPFGFMQSKTEDGISYENPTKFIEDTLKLELQTIRRLRDGSSFEKERYHLYYLCKSFLYAGITLNSEWIYKYFPYGKSDVKAFLERGVYHFSEFIKKSDPDWLLYYQRSQLYDALEQYPNKISDLFKSIELNNRRSEPICDLYEFYKNKDIDMARIFASKLKNSNFKIEEDPYEVLTFKYYQYNEDLRREIDKIIV